VRIFWEQPDAGVLRFEIEPPADMSLELELPRQGEHVLGPYIRLRQDVRDVISDLVSRHIVPSHTVAESGKLQSETI